MTESGLVSVTVVDGVGGPSAYLNDHRVVGPKPWGGGTILHDWKADADEVDRALGIPARLAAARAEALAEIRRGVEGLARWGVGEPFVMVAAVLALLAVPPNREGRG